MNTKLYKGEVKIQVIAHVVMIFFALMALIPFVLLIICSFTEENYAIREGFSFFPQLWSTKAYQYLLDEWKQIGHAYLMSFVVMVVGTVASVAISMMLAYGLSRDIPGKRLLNLFVILTMLFSGGVVSSYIIWSNIFFIKIYFNDFNRSFINNIFITFLFTSFYTINCLINNIT